MHCPPLSLYLISSFPSLRKVVVGDLTQCDESALTKQLVEASTPRLERLELRMCGRGFGDKVQFVEFISQASGKWLSDTTIFKASHAYHAGCVLQVASALGMAKLENLKVLIIAGAYRLSDAGVKAMLRSVPKLENFHLPDCCQLQDCVQSFPLLAPNLKVSAAFININDRQNAAEG
eukprot:scaffold145681_cov40-Prasinocladus_malaysianus.AAC.2